MSVSDLFNLSSFETYRHLFETDSPWDVLERLRLFFETFQATKKPEVPTHVWLENPEQIQIETGVHLEPGVFLQGPCIIQAGSIIRHGASVYAGSIIGPDAIVGHCTEIKRSILLCESKAPHFNYVGDSIIGSRANLGAGFVCANVRLDKKEVHIQTTQGLIPTGRHKVGAFVGDDSFLGCNGVSNPGTVLKKKTKTRPCETVKGNWHGS